MRSLARRFLEECRRRQVILPGSSVLERLCADALVAAERRIEMRIAAGLDDAMRLRLDRLLAEEVDGNVSRFVWLRRFEVGQNSADINALLDRLEFLQGFDLPSDLLETVPLSNPATRLRRTNERLSVCRSKATVNLTNQAIVEDLGSGVPRRKSRSLSLFRDRNSRVDLPVRRVHCRALTDPAQDEPAVSAGPTWNLRPALPSFGGSGALHECRSPAGLCSMSRTMIHLMRCGGMAKGTALEDDECRQWRWKGSSASW